MVTEGKSHEAPICPLLSRLICYPGTERVQLTEDYLRLRWGDLTDEQLEEAKVEHLEHYPGEWPPFVQKQVRKKELITQECIEDRCAFWREEIAEMATETVAIRIPAGCSLVMKGFSVQED